MGLWNFFGGNKIGPGHPRYEREQRKHNESLKLHFRVISSEIMEYGMPDTLKYESEEDIIGVLKEFSNCPKITDNWGNIRAGHHEYQINNWKQAQKWLKEKENTKYTQQLEQKIKDQEGRIRKLQKQSSYEKE